MGARSPNKLLGALAAADYRRILPDLRSVHIANGDKLGQCGETRVYFPCAGLCSVRSEMEDGGMVEVAMVGREGLVGIGAFLGDAMSTGDAVVQVQAEGAQAMNLDVFRREMDRRGPLYDVVNRYSQAFVGLIMQSVACNGLHSAEERCCRWLLMTQDRIERDEFALTHEFLAIMLGVRRPTVTLVLAELQRAGIVAHVRGQVRIVDRKALEGASCECYKTVKTLFERLLP